ncbi:MAG: hypothetical protein NXI04_17020 [Planctomycetaceae bacterium]|nr:hypothetical protein [Planctomycetaceae bacterium]
MTEPRLPLDAPNDSNDEESTVIAGRPRKLWRNLWHTRWGRILGIAAAVFVAIIAGITFLPKPGTTEQPVSWERNSNGGFTPTGTPAEDPSLEFNAASLQARNSSSKAGSSVHSGADYFASDSITVLNLSDSLLMKRAADQLVETLKEKGNFTTVRHYPAGHQPEPGERSDLFLTMDLKDIRISGITSRDLNAEIHVQLGPSPVTSRHSYSTGLTPPSLRFHAHIEIDHESTLTGVESSGAKFKLQGANIAEAIAGQVLPEIDDRRKEEDPMPQLPSGFFPDWTPPPPFDFIKTAKAEQRLSFAGCCQENETLWLVSDVDDPGRLLDLVHAELQAANWQGQRETGEPAYLRMTKQAESLEVFPRRSGGFSSDTETSVFWIRYRKVLNQEQREQLFEQLLTEQPPRMNLLMDLDRMGSSKQRQRALDLAEANPPTTAKAWLNLAGRYFYRKQQDQAVTAIQCAHLLNRIRNTDLSGQIDSLLKKNDLDKSVARQITTASLDALGVINARSLTAQSEGVKRPLTADTLVAVYSPTTNAAGDEGFRISGIYLSPASGGTNESFEVATFELQDGSSSWTSGSTLQNFDWQHTFRQHTPAVELLIAKDDPSHIVIRAQP